jgi:hypothetical protein
MERCAKAVCNSVIEEQYNARVAIGTWVVDCHKGNGPNRKSTIDTHARSLDQPDRASHRQHKDKLGLDVRTDMEKRKKPNNRNWSATNLEISSLSGCISASATAAGTGLSKPPLSLGELILGLGDETSGPAAAAVADAMAAAVLAALDVGDIGSLDDAGLARSVCVVPSSITKGIQDCARWLTRDLSSAPSCGVVRCGVCVGDQSCGMIRSRRSAKMARELGVMNGCPTVLVAEAQSKVSKPGRLWLQIGRQWQI